MPETLQQSRDHSGAGYIGASQATTQGKGARAAIGKKGFTADLKAIASASSADFMEATTIAGPKESIGSACTRPEIPRR